LREEHLAEVSPEKRPGGVKVATKVILPKQGLQMTEGTITKWIIQEGQQVELDAPLFEMETDKLNIEITSPAAGTLLKIVKGEGEVVPITEMIAVIGKPGEDISALMAEAGISSQSEASAATEASVSNASIAAAEAQASPAANVERAANERIFATPRAKTTAAQKAIDYHQVAGTGPDGLIIEKDILAFHASMAAVPKVTPLAAKVAHQKDVLLTDVEGTGTRGKITRSDVEAAIASRAGKAATSVRNGRVVPFAGMRKVISDRMMQSLHGMAQANHRMKVDMSEIVRFREKLKEAGIKVSFTDMIVKVVSKALLDFPIVNSSWTSEGILLKDYVNIGLAVAVEGGLVVPVIKDADLLTLEEISVLTSELAGKAKKGILKPHECTGGTFTITNLGMFDIDEFTAIINPPESAILAVGKIDKVPVVEGDSIVVKPMMMLSLSYDHRLIDGAPAAQFLQRIKQLMQNPYLLV